MSDATRWESAELGTLATITSGGTPSKARPEYWGGAIPWVTAKDMKTFELRQSALTITDIGAKNGCRIAAAQSTLILVRGMTLLKELPVCFTATEMAFNQDVRALQVNDGIDPRFFAYSLLANSEKLRERVNIAGHGTGRLSTDALTAFTIRYPIHVAEQVAIANVLMGWDKASHQLSVLITAKERLNQALMQQLVTGKIRIRGSRGKWKSLHLGDLFTNRKEPGGNGLPLLSVTLDEGIVRREGRDNRVVRTSLNDESHLLVRKGDIAYNTMRMWQGGCGVAGEDGLVSPAYVVCKPTKAIDSRFAHHLFQAPHMIYRFWAYSYGLTDDRRRLYYDSFSLVPVKVPPIKEQQQIAALLDALDSQISQLKRQREALAKQKRGLMQQLLTGKKRVPKSLLKKRAKK